MSKNLFSVTVVSLSFEYPKGDLLFSDLNFSLGSEKYGLVGANGVGKSTLARLLAAELVPTQGEVRATQAVHYMAQSQEREAQSVAEYLMPLWESPWADPGVWGPLIEGIDLEKNIQVLSGGEWTRLRIAHALSQSQGLLILDEPTNNLDQVAREFIVRFVQSFQGALLVISHDRQLLNYVDKVLEISSQGLAVFGGNFEFYQEERERIKQNEIQRIDRARHDKKRMEREYHEKNSSQEKRVREGNKKGLSGSLPRILVGGLKRQAQKTQGRIQSQEKERVERAQTEFRDLWDSSKKEGLLNLDLPAVYLPEGKLVFELENYNVLWSQSESALWKEDISLIMKGPKRWALAGDNGSGKSTLINSLCGRLPPEALPQGRCHLGEVVVAVLDQQYSLLTPGSSVLENVMEKTDRGQIEIRNMLARFEFLGDTPLQDVNTLSGGQKLKAALAKILLQNPAPQLLILDEPTNNLSLDSLEVLEAALLEYRGALLVVSHDEEFLKNIGIEEVYVLQTSKT